MNLHGIVSGAIGAVNPNGPLVLDISTGYTSNPDKSRTPTYAAPVSVTGQVQALTLKDLRQLDFLNIQGSEQAIYFFGEVDAIRRVSKKGGDLVQTRDGRLWLTTQVLEQWPDWCKVSVTLQSAP